MANKEVLDQLTAERLTRTTDLYALPGAGQDVIAILIASWRREADLLARSQRKGWQSEQKTLAAATALLNLELTALTKHANLPVNGVRREPVTGPTPSWTNPQALAALVEDSAARGLGELIAGDENCPAVDLGTPHAAHTWVGRQLGERSRWRCAGWNVPLITPAASVADFLSGAVDELPVLSFDPNDRMNVPIAYGAGSLPEFSATFTQHVDDRTAESLASTVAVIERLGTHLYRESNVHEEIDAAMPDVHADPLPMFREADSPSGFTRPIPPAGARLVPHTWAELAKPADPSTIPEHMSPSQLTGLDTCPAQMRLSRYEGNPGIPLWGAVGGTAFHKAVELIERGAAASPEDKGIKDWASDPGALRDHWENTFQLTIMAELTKSGVPMSDWHASNRGKENYSWWRVEGGEMLRRYVDYRATLDDGREVLVLPDGRLAIELELNLTLDTDPTGLIFDGSHATPVKAILDIVWLLPDGSLDIWDHKTRQDFMGPIVDTIQLGTQGHLLNALLDDMERADGRPWGAITTRYFDARKGATTEAFDPLDKHPIEELEMRYADADDKRRNRPAIPVRSNLCKACPVAYLCPVGSKL